MSRQSLSRFWLGRPLNPFDFDTRKHIALVAFFAWIGLGADGISSSCYGPEEAFLVLQQHPQLAIFLALATGITVFLISFSYLQVIELFPKGGGGYRVASTLLGPRAGLVSGSALLIDYVLTIAISVASGIDSFFSILPLEMQVYKLAVELAVVVFLTYLNLRGLKESIKILMPIFLGFIILHFILIIAGIFGHSEGVTTLIPEAVDETRNMASEVGWFAVLALFFKAFSLGGGTYTGLEAVSNSMHHLAEPKVRTAKNTMVAVAASLAFMACGIIMLYLLWDVEKIHGETLNATAFRAITADWSIAGFNISGLFVGVTMLFSAGLLFVAGNAGFIAGPAVLSGMAVDRWMPHIFSLLSNRLVAKNGIILMGLAAGGALLVTGGVVHILVVLYSINVFLTFSLSLAGLSSYRWRKRRRKGSLRKMVIPFLSFIICVFILIVTIIEKFSHGGWITLLVTGSLIWAGLNIRRQYDTLARQVEQTETTLIEAFSSKRNKHSVDPEKLEIDPEKPTAVFIIDESAASGLHTMLWVQREFPRTYTNFIFASVGEFDTEEFSDREKWHKLNIDTVKRLEQYVEYCHDRGIPSKYYHAYSTHVAERMEKLADQIATDYPRATFFAAKVVSDSENFMTQLLHNQIVYVLQKRLHNRGRTLIIMPMKL